MTALSDTDSFVLQQSDVPENVQLGTLRAYLSPSGEATEVSALNLVVNPSGGATVAYSGPAKLHKIIMWGGTLSNNIISVYDSDTNLTDSSSLVGRFTLRPYQTSYITQTTVWEINWPMQNGIAITLDTTDTSPVSGVSVSYTPTSA